MTAIPIDASGRFAGYASVFNVADEGGDIVMPGAFRNTLRAKAPLGIKMLFQHDPKEPIGLWRVLREDGYGLWAEGQLIEGVPRADALRRLIEKRAVDGLSIGFRTERAQRDGRSGQRRLIEIELWEISVVAFPMLGVARIAAPDDGLKGALRAAISLFET